MSIIEIQSICQVSQYLDDKTHLFLDLDNTLITSVSEFGSERWERFMIEYFMQSGMDEKEATTKASHLWKAVQTVSEIQFVEKETADFVKKLKIPTFAITARDVGFQSVTEEQLEFLGLKFSPIQFQPEAHYAKGVFYCGFTPKGEVLKWYQDKHPGAKVVIVDDYRSHLETAQNILGSSFIGLRYGFLDGRKAQYKPCEVTKLLGKMFNHPKATHHLLKGIS